MNIENLINEYLGSSRYKKLSAASKMTYKGAADKAISKIGKRSLAKINRPMLIGVFEEIAEKTPASANVFASFMSVVFGYALDKGYAESNPAARLKRRRLGEHKRWSVSDVKRVVSLNDRRVSTAVALAWYTAQREGDILAMKWSDYKDGVLSIDQQKTGLTMQIKVHPDLAIFLEKIRADAKDTDFIVSGQKKLKSPAFRYIFKQRLMDAGVNKVFHGIRKGIACALSENGHPLSDIAAFLGHKSTRMTEHYVKEVDNAKLIKRAVRGIDGVV